jgi:predicted metal-dependent phosphotriesterase family hydrolase
MGVETVRGAMAVDGLGTTLIHEHVFVLTPSTRPRSRRCWSTTPPRYFTGGQE